VELWLDAEIRIRRDDQLETARRRGLARLSAGGRHPTIRMRIAERAQAMSDALAALARSLRNGETAQ
jgi:hypothetical protein